MNMATLGGAVVLNEDYLDMGLMSIPDKWGYFVMKDLHLDYYDNYIGMGITPQFKKYNGSDFDENKNQSWPFNNTQTLFKKIVSLYEDYDEEEIYNGGGNITEIIDQMEL